ncbi:MAG: hypothetical protein DHS20C21_05500 [Gemmatimonadota bacterium]|nr:MAG: hypothetical protein DHS20C21_05500 [Gemmatimonadota bacterium]
MVSTRSIYRTPAELVRAFLEQPLPKEIYQLSRFEKVDAPWGPPPHGSSPVEYAAAWARGYDGGPIRGAFRWLGQQGLEACLQYLPRNQRGRGRVPKRALIEEFDELPESERVASYSLRHGAALHDIQELLFGFAEIWAELDKTRPDTWAIDELIEILAARNNRGRSMEAVPATFVFLWGSSDEVYHARQLSKAERILVHGLKEVMPGQF